MKRRSVFKILAGMFAAPAIIGKAVSQPVSGGVDTCALSQWEEQPYTELSITTTNPLSVIVNARRGDVILMVMPDGESYSYINLRENEWQPHDVIESLSLYTNDMLINIASRTNRVYLVGSVYDERVKREQDMLLKKLNQNE